jgi:hypothetical protein
LTRRAYYLPVICRGGRGFGSAAALLAASSLVALVDPQPSPSAPELARIAFTHAGGIFTIAADGSDRRQLPIAAAGTPAYSPNGAQLAFSTGRQVVVAAADASDQHPITTARRREFVAEVQWSPDRGRLVFMRLRPTRTAFVTEIVAMRVDGTDERVLARGRFTFAPKTALLGQPSWSPDGQNIIYTSTSLGRDSYFKPTLRIVNADGSGDRLLAPKAQDGSWSPDGSKIAFASVRDRHGTDCGEDECDYNGEIYLMNADGSGLVRLTDNEGDDEGPVWSADGSRIAFSSDRNYPEGRSPEIYSMRSDGSCLTWLTNGTPESALPAWLPSPGASPDPGACGATPRPALVETRLRPARGVHDRPIFWLGTMHDGLLLSTVERFGGEVFMNYGDCGLYEPSDCPGEVQLQEKPICAEHKGLVELAGAVRRYLRRRGVLVADYGGAGGIDAYVGSTDIRLFSGGFHEGGRDLPGELKVFRDLVRLGGTVPPQRLPHSRFPRHVLHELRKSVRLKRGFGLSGATQAIGITEDKMRKRLRLARAVRRFGPVRGVSCG